jgi:ATP-dependent helicase STH1/SNF2
VEASLLSEEEYLLLTGRLHRVLRPFVMRRLKETVAKELPGKVRPGVLG